MSGPPVAAERILVVQSGFLGDVVLTGHGRATRRALDADVPVAHVARNFRAAAKWIIDDAVRSARHRRR